MLNKIKIVMKRFLVRQDSRLAVKVIATIATHCKENKEMISWR